MTWNGLVYITVHAPACYKAGKAVDYSSSQFTRDFFASPFFSSISEPFFSTSKPLIDP